MKSNPKVGKFGWGAALRAAQVTELPPLQCHQELPLTLQPGIPQGGKVAARGSSAALKSPK